MGDRGTFGDEGAPDLWKQGDEEGESPRSRPEGPPRDADRFPGESEGAVPDPPASEPPSREGTTPRGSSSGESGAVPAPAVDRDRPRRLTRSRSDRMLGGVAGGLAEYFAVDPVLVRIGLVLLFFATSLLPVGIAYVVAWAIIPEQSSREVETVTARVPRRDGSRDGRFLLGILLVGVGGYLLLRELIPIGGDVIAAAALVAVGIVILLQGIRG